MNEIINSQSCLVTLEENFLTPEEAEDLQLFLTNSCSWSQDKLLLMGRLIDSPRLMFSFGDEGKSYSYTGVTRISQGWPKELLPIKERVEERVGHSYNYVLVNYYRDGHDYIGYHSDKEKDLVFGSTIASLSLGASRRFKFRHIEKKETLDIVLKSGDLLLMSGQTQKYYKHSLPKALRVKEPRINLTFRLVK